jgi:alpha-glucosidase
MQEITPRSASRGIGQYQSHQQINTGLLIKSTAGNLSIIVFTSDVVQIRFSFADLGEDFSYAVVGKPQQPKFRVDVGSVQLILFTESLKVKISKPSLHISITDLNDQVINEDDAGLGIQINGEQINCYKKLQEGERFIGLGEKNGPLDKRGRGYVNWNTDAYAYSPDADPLYCSVPFYIGLHHQKVYGIYFDNSYRSTFNFGASTDRFSSFSADAGEMNYYFIGGSSVQSIIQSYTYLTGRTPLPPLWSIGYQQCRYSYYPDREVLRVAENFRERDLPGDAIVLDIHYMDAYKIFTWDKENFPDPKGLIEKLKSLGFHVVVMCDPGIKVEEGYEPYESGKKEQVFIKYPDGTNYSGQVWPGWCHFPDFTKDEARSWWANHFKEYVELGVDGFWNDMNEIATWGNMLPDLMEFDFDGRKSTTREGRNVYGMMMARSTYEGTKGLMNKRPFNLTRSGFAGIQRYAAVWTGDNVAYDGHMMAGIRLVNSMGLSGMAFTGYDIGGFVGNADEKLFARWITIGAFSPFFRGHTMINTRDSEPWSYGEKVEEISRNYMKLRYRLLPYLYSLFYDASKTGMPINRSLAISYPFDDKIYDHQYHNQYLFGPSILVVPAESNKELVKAYLPNGNWYNLLTDQPFQGNQEIIVECPIDKLPVYVKGSALIPMREKAGITTQDIGDTLEVHVYKGETNNEFTLYEDDGISFDYEKDAFAKRDISYSSAQDELTIGAQVGSYHSVFKFAKIYLHGFNSVNKIWVNNTQHQIEKKEYRFINPIKNYDPVGDAPEGPKINLPFVKLTYESSKIIIRWSVN